MMIRCPRQSLTEVQHIRQELIALDSDYASEAYYKNHTMLLAKRLTISWIIATCSNVSLVCTLRS
jgi:hypothetical protein